MPGTLVSKAYSGRARAAHQPLLDRLDLLAQRADHRDVAAQRQRDFRLQPERGDHRGAQLLGALGTDPLRTLARQDVLHRQNMLGTASHQLHALSGEIAHGALVPWGRCRRAEAAPGAAGAPGDGHRSCHRRA
jgi:hypothetical protein